MAFAPTRSGKGVGLVLPTLLSWPHSAVIYDIKGENWALTAGWRKQEGGNHAIKFEPSAIDGSSARFNPLTEVRVGTDREVADVQNIMTMIVDPDGKGLQDHWQKSSQALLVGVALHVLYAEPDKTLNGIVSFLSDPTRDVEKAMKFILDTDHDLSGPGWPNRDGSPNYCHPVAAAAARDMLNKAEEERSGVISTAISYLTLYRDPIVARNTAVSDFRIHDLMNAEKPVSLYLVVPPSDKDRLRPLIRLTINQIVRGLTEKMEFKDGRSVTAHKHRLLLMLDEFPSLGKLDVFEESLAFIAGYGLKAYLIIQDIAQLWTAYGKDESIFSNCQVRIAYAPNKIETADLLSKMTGIATVVKHSHSYSGSLYGSQSNISTSTQETQRPLLTADEVMRLPAARKDARGNVIEPGDMLIFMAGQTPIYGKQILYFIDPIFSARAKLPAPEKSDVLSGK
jgi:type IV secretion system protein VirD4